MWAEDFLVGLSSHRDPRSDSVEQTLEDRAKSGNAGGYYYDIYFEPVKAWCE